MNQFSLGQQNKGADNLGNPVYAVIKEHTNRVYLKKGPRNVTDAQYSFLDCGCLIMFFDTDNDREGQITFESKDCTYMKE